MTDATSLPKTGEVHIVRFHPAIGSELKRYRPALVISDTATKVDLRFTSILALSSRGSEDSIYEHRLKVDSYPFLNKDSFVLCWYPNTIDSSRLIEKIGEISATDLNSIRRKFNQLFL